MNILLVNCIVNKDYGEPVSILFLAAYLRKQNFIVDIYDPQIHGDEDLQFLKEKCRYKNYGLIGFSVLTSSDKSLLLLNRMTTIAKNSSPKSFICCGGIGVSLRYNDFLNLQNVDYVILGEGELTITELATALSQKLSIKGIKGIASKKKPYFEKRELITNLDSIPFMARDTLEERLIDIPKTKRKAFEVRIFCGRGCFGCCTFCANISVSNLCIGERCRQRSIESLAQEMEEVHEKYQIIRFSFWDDNFLPKGEKGIIKANKIYSIFSKMSFKPIFGIQTRVDTIDDNVIGILQQVGLQNIYMGVENISKDELEILGKQINEKQIKKSLDILYKHGYSYQSEAKYRLRLGYIAFTPFSTIDSIYKNVDFICKYNIPINKIAKKLLAFHNTPIRDYIKRVGLLKDDFNWKFRNEKMEDVYNTLENVISIYSKVYDELRFISKVIKYNNISFDFAQIIDAKNDLGDITKNTVQYIMHKLLEDIENLNKIDSYVQEYCEQIDDCIKKYDLIKTFTNFRVKYKNEIEEFRKVSYVFFD